MMGDKYWQQTVVIVGLVVMAYFVGLWDGATEAVKVLEEVQVQVQEVVQEVEPTAKIRCAKLPKDHVGREGLVGWLYLFGVPRTVEPLLGCFSGPVPGSWLEIEVIENGRD